MSQVVALPTEQELLTSIQGTWTLICGFGVFFMQVGFAMVEAGIVRPENTNDILLKNVMDATCSAVIWWTFGYGFAFGAGRLWGTTNFFVEDPTKFVECFYQWTFACASQTIVAGAVAERCHFNTYIVYSIAVSGLMYPIVCHAVWNEEGFLYNLSLFGRPTQFHDHAGACCVHMVGGAASLVGAALLGPRYRRFKTEVVKGRKKIVTDLHYPGQSMAHVVLGSMLLWFCWFFFNCGVSKDINQASLVGINTALGGAMGGITGAFIAHLEGGMENNLATVVNSLLSGLVSITGSCDWITPYFAMLSGSVGALAFYGGSKLVAAWGIDDPCDAAAVHLFGGIWGVMANGLFSKTEGLFTVGSGYQLLAQFVGALVVWFWVTVLGLIVFGSLSVLQKFNVCRFRRYFAAETAGLEPELAKNEQDYRAYLLEEMKRHQRHRTSVVLDGKIDPTPLLAIENGAATLVAENKALTHPLEPREDDELVPFVPSSTNNLKPATERMPSTPKTPSGERPSNPSSFPKTPTDTRPSNPSSFSSSSSSSSPPCAVSSPGFRPVMSPHHRQKSRDLTFLLEPGHGMGERNSIDRGSRPLPGAHNRQSSRGILDERASIFAPSEKMSMYSERTMSERGSHFTDRASHLRASSRSMIAVQHSRVVPAPRHGKSDSIPEGHPTEILSTGEKFAMQIASDIHMEMWGRQRFYPREHLINNVVQPNAPILALLGDICVCGETVRFNDYQEFILHQSRKFKQVLVLVGNHEFYCDPQHPVTTNNVLLSIQEFCSTLPNVHFLENTVIEIDGVRIFGATMWSSIPDFAANVVQSAVNDFDMIYVEDEKGQPRKLTVPDVTALHAHTLKQLVIAAKQAKADKKPMVVLTHHAPTYRGSSDPRHENSPIASAFCSSLEYLMDWKGTAETSSIHTWCFGHTHYCSDQKINGVRVVSNQYGYDGTSNTSYDDRFEVHMD